MAKKARVWTGTEFVELASAQTDLTAYSTTAQMNTAITAAKVDTVLSSGTFTTASAVNLSSVLSDTYPFYTLNIYATLASSNSTLNLRFRQDTTDLVGTGYAIGSFFVQTTGTSGNYASNGDAGIVQLAGIVNNYKTHVVVDISRQSATTGLLTWQAYDGYFNYSITGGGRNVSLTNFNGLSFFPAASTITGYYILTGRKA